MKRSAPLVALLLCLTVLSLPLLAATTTPAKTAEKTPGLEIAALLTQVTGVAISPLLGVSAIGTYRWIQASTPEEKAKLPWYASPAFWLCGLLLVGAVAAKDTLGATLPPGWKKPLDIADTFENKVSGLVAAGAVIPSLVTFGSKFIMSGDAATAVTVTAALPGMAMLPIASIDSSWLLSILMVPLSIAVFAVVWLTSHAINVLILLSPWGAIDAALKGVRTGMLALVTGTAWIDPVVGATLSAVIVVIAYFTAGWAFRLMVFGTVFSWDFITFRRRRFQLLADGNKLFTGGKFEGVPARTYGRLYQAADGALTLKYRPWLVMPERVVAVPREGLVVGRGVFYSEVLGHDPKSDQNRVLLLLPPRYLGHEELFARTYHISGTCEVGLRRAWSWLREGLGFGPKKVSAPAAA